MHKNDPEVILTAKKAAAHAAVDFIENGMLIGLGSGSTALLLIQALSIRCREGLTISAVATSTESALEAHRVGITLRDPETVSSLDLTIDGADEIDPDKNMIKGGGGALFKEKLAARSCKEMVVIIDWTKRVDRLGRFPLPVEISRFLYPHTIQALNDLGYRCCLRGEKDTAPFITDSGNYIVDIKREKPIIDLPLENSKLKSIPGVIETGLFYEIAGRVIVGKKDGTIEIF